MVKFSFSHLPAFWRKGAALILASFFFLGHFLGVWFSSSASDPFYAAMRAAVSSRVSIPGLLSAMILPFLFSAFAVYLKQPMLLIPVAFLKAFFFSYVGYGFFAACGSAGWLVTWLAMFGSLCSLPVLYCYWRLHLNGKPFDPLLFFLGLGILVIIGCIDYFAVSPFLVSILTF